MDRVLLNKMLDCDFTLSNVFMRTCKKFNRYVHDNKTIMDKLSRHYQPRLETEIHFELNRLFGGEIQKNLNVRKIENILINDNHNDKKNKVSEIILFEKNGLVLKSFTFKKTDALFKKNIIAVREIKRLGDIYLNSTGHRINDDKYEKKMSTMINNFIILLKTILSYNEAKYIDQSRFPANTYLKYFILMIAVLYVRYTFMK